MKARSEKQRPSHVSAPVGSARRRAALLSFRASGQPRERLLWPIAELTALAREIDVEVVYTTVHTRSRAHEATLVGTGKLTELAALFATPAAPPYSEPTAEIMLVDAILTPQQHRALALALNVEVIDRTELVLQLFARRARTRVAKLTIEIARLQHALPRLREAGEKRGRAGGGGGRGERGNSEVTLAKERTRVRIRALEGELEQAQRALAAQRARRRGAQRVAIVGYTNAGKSSWLSALSQSETLIADRPFATLETTVRTLRHGALGREPILLLDTVGFVRDLPHELVPSFHATLEEARDADVILCVADAADANLHEQREVTEQTLAAIGAGSARRLWLLNKSDRVEPSRRGELEGAFPDALLVSALLSSDVAKVRAAITACFPEPES
jgi:GTP-binding protein HflX